MKAREPASTKSAAQEPSKLLLDESRQAVPFVERPASARNVSKWSRTTWYNTLCAGVFVLYAEEGRVMPRMSRTTRHTAWNAAFIESDPEPDTTHIQKGRSDPPSLFELRRARHSLGDGGKDRLYISFSAPPRLRGS